MLICKKIVKEKENKLECQKRRLGTYLDARNRQRRDKSEKVSH